MSKVSILIAAALLSPWGHAFAGEWLKLTSPNFELYTTTNEKRGQEIILYFEQVHDLFLRIRPNNLMNPLPVRLIAFQNSKEYKKFSFNDFAAAYYMGGDTRDYIVMGDIADGQFPVAIHEYTHLLVKHAGLKLPQWLNEGWADVNSTARPAGSQIMIGSIMPGRVSVLNHSKWMSLKTLTSVTGESAEYNEKDKASIF